jgi:hypothetical protein
MQFFAGLHLLYRIAVWSAVAFSPKDTKLYILVYLWVFILAFHSLFQPFESRRHNYLETLLMLNVALTALSFFQNGLSPVLDFFQYFVITVQAGLPSLPLFCVICYLVYKFFVWYGTVRRRSGYADLQEHAKEDKMEESYQGERWDPPNNENVL